MTKPHRLAAALLVLFVLTGRATADLELRKGDHICVIGNTLADRMQHHGWLETLIQSRFSKLELSYRDLGYSADELTVRPREENFGDPDSHLKHCGADVIFAFFGYNESFGGDEGLSKFKEDLARFIDHTLAQKYNGESAPLLVVFSPIAHEDLGDPSLPDGKENNVRLAKYSEAMAEVCAAKGVANFDLFHPTQSLYGQVEEPLTVNGIHLNERGNRELARIIDHALFGASEKRDEARLEKVRDAVLEKNLIWFNRYRATDGYSQFGGRSGLQFIDGQTNREVMTRELEILDVMAANRDKAIWAAANGEEFKVDDSNAPPQIPVITNLKGLGPLGEHVFLSGEEAISKMTIADGFKINLFADEKQFPELAKLVQTAVDPDGRLWVAAWPSYPHWRPGDEMNDKLVILPDDDGDGKADRCITWADGLHNPTGFEFWNGGVVVAQAPEIIFLKDTDGDDKADLKIHLLSGIESADTHHTANSFVIGPDGALYYQRGIFHVTNIETPWGPPFRADSNVAGVYRFDPRTFAVSFHFPVGPNAHGDTFDRWGYHFCTDGTSGTGYYVGFPGRGAPKQLYEKRVRPVPAIAILSSEHFPSSNQGNLLIANVIGFQGIIQLKFEDQGAGFHANEIEPIVYSSDPNFRPSDMEIGGDGALYFSDWQNPIIGHMQHNLRDPSRDHVHGRVYRVTAEGRPLMKPVKMSGRPIEEVLEHLKSPTNSVRYRARLELTGRDPKQVAAAATKWAEKFDANNPDEAHHLTEALWVHQMNKQVNEPLLRKVLASAEPNARAAATRVLRDWFPKIENVGQLLVQLADDKHPRVRAEAVVAAALHPGLEAAEVIFAAEQWPKDQQLEFVLAEARKSINVDQFLQTALNEGRTLSPAAQAYMLRSASVEQLLQLERSEAVYRAILGRQNVPLETLRESLAGLAKLKRASEQALLLGLIEDLDAKQQAGSFAGLGTLLVNLPAGELRGVADRLQRLAAEGHTADVRRLGYAAWITAAGNAKDALAAATRDKNSLRLLLESVPLISDETARGELFPALRPLAFELPSSLEKEPGGSSLGEPGIQVDFFSPNPPNVAIETLAKLQPKASGIVPEIKFDVPQLQTRDAMALKFSGLLRVDQAGKYTFFITSDDGSRVYIGDQLLIDNDGLHGPIEKAGAIELAAGLHPLTVTYFDNGGGDALAVAWAGPGFDKQPIPAARLSVAGAETLHDLAIRTLAKLPGHEQEKFVDLAKLIHADQHRTSAVRAMLAIPAEAWPAELVGPLAEKLAEQVAEIPARYRTSQAALEAMKLTDELAAKLPEEQARRLQSKLLDLQVQVIRIGTVSHRMIFDKERLVVQAGKPVEFVFANTDDMPHNFAIVLPGALAEVGELGEATGRDPDAAARQYIPKSDKVLLGSKLLQPGETQALPFEVPNKPGVYPYVCTYPGHWRRMYGALYVVADLKAYLNDPVSYLNDNPMPLEDELLKYARRDTEWKYEDLAAIVSNPGGLPEGRSFEVGRSLFQVANCVACHKLGDVGQVNIGPDLAKLEEKKLTPESILRNVLDPSKEIEEKYHTWTFALTSGDVVKGMILEDTPEEIKVAVDPLAKKDPVVVKKSDIAEQGKAALSIMPIGLLSKLTPEEIADLLAFVHAKGDKGHKLYEAGHEH